jgi:lipoprotein
MVKKIIRALLIIVVLSSCKKDFTPPVLRHRQEPYTGSLIRTDGYYYHFGYDTYTERSTMSVLAFFRDGRCLAYQDIPIPPESYDDFEYVEQKKLAPGGWFTKKFNPYGVFWLEGRVLHLENPGYTGLYTGRQYTTHENRAIVNRDGSITTIEYRGQELRPFRKSITLLFREYHGEIKW